MAQYIVKRDIYNIVMAKERITGSPELLRWWDKSGIRFGELEGVDDDLDLDMVY